MSPGLGVESLVSLVMVIGAGWSTMVMSVLVQLAGSGGRRSSWCWVRCTVAVF